VPFKLVVSPALAAQLATLVALVLLAPSAVRAFGRRGTGVIHERNFGVQRAPQVVSLGILALILVGHLDSELGDVVVPWLNVLPLLPPVVAATVGWLGVALLVSGYGFLRTGYSALGGNLSTDAELLEGQTLTHSGPYRWVMHPVYSGIVQALVGGALTCGSLPALALTTFAAAPLWLHRARYEERLLVDAFGSAYRDYAESVRWRRLVPSWLPFGV